jgi:hypothetical protein
MAKACILSNRGKEAFIDYLQTVRNGSDEPPPISRLSKEPWSEELSPVIEVSNAPSATRLELGEYLVNLLEASGLARKELVENTGLWSWLALFWFDLICPKEENGIRKVRETARYICSAEWRNYYRHLIAASWDIYHMYRESSRLFLWCKLDIHNDFMEQLASRQDIITTKTLIEAVDRLYWDPKMKRPKVNATNRKVAGNIRRLLSVANQLKLTYDLHTMSALEIVKLLPHEFDTWQ